MVKMIYLILIWYLVGVIGLILCSYLNSKEKEITVADVVFSILFGWLGPIFIFILVVFIFTENLNKLSHIVLWRRKK
jgi:uncharacterized membrane protein